MTTMTKARIPAAIKAHVFASFDCCAACGTWDADECGHLVAESKGGAMVKENFVRLCGSCNRMQGTAQVVFAAYAAYTESPAMITSRRAYWARYVKAAAVGIAKPYKPVA
jgi:HNH endonuclease